MKTPNLKESYYLKVIKMSSQYIYEIITNLDCNLRCSYCFAKDKVTTKVMDKNTIDNLILWINSKHEDNTDDRIVYKIYGGESMLHIDTLVYLIKRIQTLSKFNDYSIDLITNGTIYDPKIFEELMTQVPQLFIGISIDGVKGIHDKYRRFVNGSPSYDHIINNLKKINPKYKDRINLQYVITNEITSRMDEVITNLSGLGFRQAGLFFTDENAKDLDLVKFERALHICFKRIKGSGYEYRFKFDYCGFNKLKHGYCGAGNTYFCITPHGKIYPCSLAIHHKLDEFCIGDVNNGGLVNSPVYREFKNMNVSSRCEVCETNSKCTGYCIFNNYIQNGNFMVPVQGVCDIAKVYSKVYNQYYDLNGNYIK